MTDPTPGHGPLAPSTPTHVPPLTRRAGWVVFWAVWTFFALFLGTHYYLVGELYGHRLTVAQGYVLGFWDMYTWALVCIAAFALAARLPLERGRWVTALVVVLLVGQVVLLLKGMADALFVGAVDWLPKARFTSYAIGRLATRNFAFLSLVGVGYALEYFRRFREREISGSRLEAQLAQARLQILTMQLQPHFLFNTLHAISGLVHRDADAAERMIANLSEMLRVSLSRQQRDEVELREEMELLAPYLDIERMRLGERLSVQVEVEPGAEGALVPHLILQPLVENAIRHGIAPQRLPGTVRISSRRDGDRLEIVVRDDGRGLRGGAEAGGGLGLENTRRRLEHLYGEAGRLRLEEVPDGGVRVEITLPFRTDRSGSAI